MTQATATAGLFRLHRSGGGPAVQPTAEQLAVIHNGLQRLKVLAGPGTGKSATLVESVAERLAQRGVSPESVLVLTFSRRAATELASRITRRLGITTREPIVRTLHSYAYSLLRARAMRSGEPEPRLLAAGESDQMVRELLAGQRESGRGNWPPAVSAALTSPAFAAELRELMLRTAERGITPSRLAELGRRRRRPEWQAAAMFAREYQDVSDLRQGSSGLGAALDQAELTRAALGLLAQDAVLAAEQSRIRRIFVDEFQDVDPSQAALIQALASGADELVVFGDPDQSIYGFRGSDPAALRDLDVDDTVMLTGSRRMSAEVLAASRRVARMLPGVSTHRQLIAVGAAEPAPDRAQGASTTNAAVGTMDAASGTMDAASGTMDAASGTMDAAAGVVDAAAGHVGSESARNGRVIVRTMPTAATEAAYVADELRRAHLQSGVRWSDMAVLVRSPVAALPALRRAFAAAGVPLTTSRQDEQLTADPVVAALLTVLQCGRQPSSLTGQVALDLLASPAGGTDSQSLRRLRRMIRAEQPDGGPTPDLLAAVLAGAPLPDRVPEEFQRPVRRVRAMLDAARMGAADAAAEQSLWKVWQASELEEQLVSASLRGGRAGQRADQTLDGVMSLFSMAADQADRTPLAGVEAFLDMVTGQRIPGDPTARGARSGDAVSVLSAHAAKGLEWDVVALAGVAEGSWPVLRPRVSLLGTSEVFDAAAGLPSSMPTTAALLQEERRLFYVAVTRARHTVIATSVADQDTVPSRFLFELAGAEEELPAGWPAAADGGQRRGLHLTDLIAELRSVVTDPSVPEQTAHSAAVQLARLAAAGVVGADPRDWYGLAARSTDEPAIPAGSPVTVSPSAVDSLSTCALRGVLERRGARGATSQQQIEGIVVHALVDGLAKGVSRAVLEDEMEGFLRQQHHLPPWLVARTRRALESMLTAAQSWVAALPAGRTMVASELRLSVPVPPSDIRSDSAAGEAARPVRLEGRADRLDRTADGSLIVVDFKTGATVPSKAKVLENTQLAVYQLALDLGASAGLGPRASGAQADEPPLDPEEEEMLGTPVVRPEPARPADRTRADRTTRAAVQTSEDRTRAGRDRLDPGGREPGYAATDSADTDSADTDSADTDSADTDSADTDSADTDGADTDGVDTGSAGRGRSGGAELVYLRTGSPQIRQQPALTAEQLSQWRRIVRGSAEQLALSISTAQENRYCERCPVRSSCPLQPEGRQVTR